jgi:hypothetical protein
MPIDVAGLSNTQSNTKDSRDRNGAALASLQLRTVAKCEHRPRSSVAKVYRSEVVTTERSLHFLLDDQFVSLPRGRFL